HRALHRHSLILGAERELVLTTGLFAFTLIFAALSWFAALAGLSLWLIGLALLRQMAKADAQLSKVYLRHIKYQAYYPAHSTPFRKES
ncbi:MAG: conjugal transfer protein TrbD, partial [Candidatus Tectomicrobia bacterium]|nr:conjugal transfer protein TrbD [Candidatus Tectomicrobia bacterium]